MEIYQGKAACRGIAIGKIQYLWTNEQQRLRVHNAEVARQEIEHFHVATNRALEALSLLCEGAGGELTDSDLNVLQGQMKLLEDGAFSRAIESMITSEKVSATYAVSTTRKEMTEYFSNIEEPQIQNYLEDLQDLSERLILILEGLSRDGYTNMDPTILVADHMSPSEVIAWQQEKLLAFVTHEGSVVSHTSIISRTLNIPSLVGVSVNPLWDEREAIVDGFTGTLYLDPDEQTKQKFEQARQQDLEDSRKLLSLKDQKDVTRDGTKVRLYTNIRSVEDLRAVREVGAAGIGLLRSEFQYMARDNYPSESELFRVYREVGVAMEGKPVIIRTLDIGADKKADYMKLPKEENPVMGNRGIRICLERRDLFEEQLRAIFRAAHYGNLAVMYPMITSLDEVMQVKEIAEDVISDLRRKEIPYGTVSHGVLIETPAAVMVADELAREVDFFSIGTNDLTQYVLAMDAQNPDLQEKFDICHPAVLRMIQMAIDAGHRYGKWVGVCGELAADTSMTQTLLNMGADMLSVVPPAVLPLRKKIRELNLR